MSEKTLGQVGFDAYGEHAEWKAYDGKPMPRWDEKLRPDIKEKWEVASEAVVKAWEGYQLLERIYAEIENGCNTNEMGILAFALDTKIRKALGK